MYNPRVFFGYINPKKVIAVLLLAIILLLYVIFFIWWCIRYVISMMSDAENILDDDELFAGKLIHWKKVMSNKKTENV